MAIDQSTTLISLFSQHRTHLHSPMKSQSTMNIQSFRSTGFTVIDDLRKKKKQQQQQQRWRRKIWKVTPSQMRKIVAFRVHFDPLMSFKLLIFSLDLVKLLNLGLWEKEKKYSRRTMNESLKWCSDWLKKL